MTEQQAVHCDGGLLQKKGAEVPELRGEWSAQLKKTVALCLSANPWERPTAAQLEQYARTALAGGTIRFAGEKSFLQRYRWPLLAALVILVCAVAGLAYNGHRIRQERLLSQQAEQRRQFNDSLLGVARLQAAQARRLTAEGDRHDEYYERAYLEAYDAYGLALSAVARMDSAARAALPAPLAGLGASLDSLRAKMSAAADAFSEKAALFADDAAVSGEFQSRAAALRERLRRTAPAAPGREGKKTEPSKPQS